MRKRPLFYLACVFLTGLAYQRFSMKWLAIICVTAVFVEMKIGKQAKRIKKAAGRSVILLSAFLLGIFHMQQEENFRTAYMSKIIDGSRITVWGECIQTETTEYGERGFLSNCYIRLDEAVMPCNEIVVYTSKDQFCIGRIHKINGKVNMFSEARNEGNFDANHYYQSLKMDFAINAEEISLLGEKAGNWREGLSRFRNQISSVYDRCMSEKSAGFYKTMVLGDKKNLDEDLKSLFFIGGISHILAISGLHVSILGRGFYQTLRNRGVGFGIAGICGGAVLLVYCFMVGSSTSTVRAVGMMLCFFAAQWMGRSYDMLNSLGEVVLCLLWKNPFLIDNSGFWFSVMAILGVGIVGNELASDKMKSKGIWISFGITLATLPVSAWSYYEIPMYSTFVNLIVIPLLTPIFLLAVIGGLIGACLPIQGLLIFLFQPCEWLLDVYEWMCQMVRKIPGSSVICGKPEKWQVIMYYGVLFIGVYFLGCLRIQKKVRERMLMMISIFFLCGICIFLPKPKTLEITFLDVGQGDGIYISAGDGSAFFIDGGSSNVDRVGEYRVLPFLKSKGIKEIDYWFISHMDTDHISGVLEILEEGYPVKHIVLSECCSIDEKYVKLKTLAEQNNTEIVYMKAGHRISTRNIEIICIAPFAEQNDLDKNENSLVLYVRGEGIKALFAGDISTEMEKKLCEAGVLMDVDLFKANHHGSNNSNSSQLFSIIRPEYVVISCSATNRYGHPGEEAIERMEESGAKVFYTMEDGQITFPLVQ